MKHRVFTPVLPLALVQGLYVRAKTPRLPEPQGLRMGELGAGERLRLLILGDSAAAGVGVAQQVDALSGQLATLLSQHYSLSWHLEAENGLKAADLLERLQSLPPQAFDVAVLSVGVNDVTGRTHSIIWRQQIAELCSVLQSQFGVRRIIFSRLPPMEVFPALPRPLNRILGDRAAELTAMIAEVAAEHDGCELFDPDFPLLPEFMASDGFHPGAPAYRLWAEKLADRIVLNV